jgi:hypothetical protein
LSHKPRPIKVANTAPSETTKADEITTKTAKTGKVTAVVALIFLVKKDASCRALITEMRSLLAKRQKEPIFQRKIPADQGAFLKNQKEARYQ